MAEVDRALLDAAEFVFGDSEYSSLEPEVLPARETSPTITLHSGSERMTTAFDAEMGVGIYAFEVFALASADSGEMRDGHHLQVWWGEVGEEHEMDVALGFELDLDNGEVLLFLEEGKEVEMTPERHQKILRGLSVLSDASMELE